MAIPVRAKKVTDPFDETARARLCDVSCSSSGSEHSPELAELVNDFFMEKDDDQELDSEQEQEKRKSGMKYSGELDEDFSDDDSIKKDMMGMLKSLVGTSDDDPVQNRILTHTTLLCRNSTVGMPEFKRWLMRQLRENGFDAGLCKSRWVKSGNFPGGDYEYIDVVSGKDRYFIEVGLAGKFEIARQTSHYSALLQLFPAVFVGKSDSLKPIVQLMCKAAKESMMIKQMHVPPWRRSTYMKAMWFGGYRRTTNSIPATVAPDSGGISAGKRSIGFVGNIETPLKNCRQVFALRETLRKGHLTSAMKQV